MNKVRSVFFCRNCGAQAAKWLGRCPSCGEWNTFDEEIVSRENKQQVMPGPKTVAKALPIGQIEPGAGKRTLIPDQEFNRVLGGGLVGGSVILIAGEPGIGKSTLLLQLALQSKKKVLYVTGEESGEQIKIRADRLGYLNQECYILCETLTRNILNQVETIRPDLIIIDSIQTLQTDLIESSAGSISQIRECAAELQRYSKQTGIPVFLIGHITKDGSIAGPKILEHMVDVVLNFEGERNYGYRILRAAKNRYGSTSEIGIYEMQNSGLREVSNPSEILLSHREETLSGIAIASMIEGMRPMMIETQALVSNSAYGTPQRSSTGFDIRRLNMLLAILEKRCGYRLGVKDVFLNIAGGLRVDDPAIDLAVVSAIISSFHDIPLPQDICFAAELGLSGEIRPVSRIEQRIAEANKLGFAKIAFSKYNMKGLSPAKLQIELLPVGKLEDLVRYLGV